MNAVKFIIGTMIRKRNLRHRKIFGWLFDVLDSSRVSSIITQLSFCAGS